MVSNSVADERAMRELYLAGFERAVIMAQPWTLMCSYNKINGTYACENKETLTDILRNEWEFQGAVMTDWGAMNDRVMAAAAGLDLEMPAGSGKNDERIVTAVKEGRLDEKLLDLCARRMTAIALAASENKRETYDREAHHELARKVARESAVLLKKGEALPADKTAKIAVIGQFAQSPRYQGAGSSKINPYKLTSALDAFGARGLSFTYSEGYALDQEEQDNKLIEKAVIAAGEADVVFAFVGLPDSYESEGFDRTHLQMPDSHNKLVEALIKANPNTVAILSAGSAVEIPWRDRADSILVMHLAGENSGEAVCDLLFGDVSPCGKLAETWPLALTDTPSLPAFGKTGNVEYLESIYVGYRYYDKAKKAVAYPFGFGLSYTRFVYRDLKLDQTVLGRDATLTLTATVQNVGEMAAKEIVELYVAPPESTLFMPVRELRGYEKISLEPGECKTVSFVLEPRAFSYYHAKQKKWAVQEGTYQIEVGASSRDIRLSEAVQVVNAADCPLPDLKAAAPFYFHPENNQFPREEFKAIYGRELPEETSLRPYTVNSTLGEIKEDPIGKTLYEQIRGSMAQNFGEGDLLLMMEAMLEDMPLRGLEMFSGGALSGENLKGLLDQMNALNPTQTA